MPDAASTSPLRLYRVLLLAGGAALVGVGWLYQFGSGGFADPLVGRVSLGLSALSLGALTFTSATVRRHALSLAYVVFFVVSAWQLSMAAASGLTPTSAFGVLLVFLGCSAGIQAPRLLAVYTVVFVGGAGWAAFAVEAPSVPRGAFLATLGAVGALGVFVARARQEAVERLERAREEALEAARAKSEFLAAMSHEIRTPMNGVIGMTDLLATTPLTPDQRDYVDTIQASGRALLAVINDVLDFSKIEAGKLELEPEPVVLHAFADDAVAVVAPAASEKGLEVVCHVDRAVPVQVLVDGARLRQVALNLLSNAVKFTLAGTVALHVGVRAARGRRRRGGAPEVWLRVEDTGIGIPPEHLGSLFDSFTQVDASATRRFGGTGLGLAISKRIVEAMGGELWVESEPGVGSTFHVVVPMPEVAPPARPPAGAGTLLLVDDHAGARAAVSALAEGAGLEVRAFARADDAVAWVRDGGYYDLAAVDLTLDGEGASGVARRLRAERWSGSPLVLLAPLGARVEAPGPFDAVVAKPVRSDRFADVVARLTGTRHRLSITFDEAAAAAHVPVRVLLAEDHAVNQRVALGLLARLGVVADVARDGAEALAALDAADYELVLMDLQMPVLDGLEATRRLRRTLPAERQPRVVALTANALAGDAARCREAGMDGYLSKPVRLEDLRAELDRTRLGEPARRADPPGPAAPAPPATDAPRDAPRDAPPAPDAPSAEAIADHLLALTAGDDRLAVEILDAYLDTEATLTDQLGGPAPGPAAHKLKSACATLGADALAHAAHEVEQAAQAGADVDAAPLAEALRTFRATVRTARAGLAAPARHTA